MKYDVLQVLAMIVLVVFGQGLIRLLVDHDDLGLLGWLPGGFGVVSAVYVALTVAGAVGAGWAHTRAKALGRRGEAS
ncbi:hypothetical protein [Streptomyces roseolilacinus]|uniref:Uncharacterized protein n=1 Tax=Streptomyces roseolilacinus TaxID=66904 RepID=A0A918AZ27_9ACTN|nr:hypothetical protein [Streptomyces roseolilacinus]GGP95465.1 hypothetical protein GCM10010249_11900 [Streptomyces roseolilacinus]